MKKDAEKDAAKIKAYATSEMSKLRGELEDRAKGLDKRDKTIVKREGEQKMLSGEWDRIKDAQELVAVEKKGTKKLRADLLQKTKEMELAKGQYETRLANLEEVAPKPKKKTKK